MAVKYTQGPATYVGVGVLVIMSIGFALRARGSTTMIAIAVGCLLLAIGTVAYYRYVQLPSFKALRHAALQKDADGDWCVRDKDAYEEFRDTYINRRR
jgi:hypothetical protein